MYLPVTRQPSSLCWRNIFASLRNVTNTGNKNAYAVPSHFLDNLANDVQLAFYRPESIDAICAMTKFSRREVQVIYRSFKQVLVVFPVIAVVVVVVVPAAAA